MDVTTFMATICPIAAVAVLPIALAHGTSRAQRAPGGCSPPILALTSGISAQGLLVYAQKTIQIGTIGIAQQAQPALAVVWSFLLLGEAINGRQAARDRDRHRGTGGVRRRASARSRSVMKCDGGRHPAVGLVVAPERVEREHLDRRVAVAAARSRGALRAARPSRVERRRADVSPSAACSPPPASRCKAAARSSAARASSVRPSARRTRPRWTRPSAASRTSPVASAFAIPRSSVAAPAS